MSKQLVRPANGPAPKGPYSPGLRAGDFVFVAGQGPSDPATGAIVGATIEEQTTRTLENIKLILEAGGASLGDTVKATVYLSDLGLFDRFNAVYTNYFPDPKPVRTTVGAVLRGIMVEIDVIAYVGNE